MISKKVDCNLLLDELRDISNKYYMNTQGEVININGEIQNDEYIINQTKFYILYCMAYKALDEYNREEKILSIDKAFVTRALTSYGLFNYFINTCIAEYRMYDDIGTGKVTYLPYQPIADFFFRDENRKVLLLNYINNEILNKLENEKHKRRVK